MGHEKDARGSGSRTTTRGKRNTPAAQAWRPEPGTQSSAAKLQRRPERRWRLPFRAGAAAELPAIEGPLPPGERQVSGDVEVDQISADHALILRGDDMVEIRGSRARNQGYAFHVAAAAADAEQRVVRIAATRDVAIDEERSRQSDTPGLVCHVSRVASPEIAGAAARGPAALGMGEVLALPGAHGATLMVDGCALKIEREDENARFAYWIDPVWSGPDGRERIVHIVATPGVRAHAEDTMFGGRMDGASNAFVDFQRVLVPHLIHVQDPALVPQQGTPIDPGRYLHGRSIGGISHRSRRHRLLAVTGADGVTVRESVTGAALRIAARDPEVGARFAYQIVRPSEKPEIQGTTEIRVLTGPGVDVEILEVGPRPPMGGPPYSLERANVELVLYEVDDPALVPPQGAPLEREYLETVGRPRREPPVGYAPLTGEQQLALAVADTAAGLIPVVGDAADLAELSKAVATGSDRYGRPVSAFDLAVLGIAALLPLVGAGALRAAGRSTRGAARTLNELAARLGKTREEMEVLLVRVGELTAADREALTRVSRALRTGQEVQAEDLRHVRESLSHLGFHADLGPAAGDVFLFPDVAPVHGMRALGDGPEVTGVRETSRRAAGAARPARHHVLPQEHRAWFEERGFTGDMDIDNFTVELDEAIHQAAHGGGNWRLGRTWEGEWNRRVMQRLQNAEKERGKRLVPDEILREVESLMREYGIHGPFKKYKVKQR
jgi:hypothetical protein